MQHLIPSLTLLTSLDRPIRGGKQVDSVVIGDGAEDILKEMRSGEPLHGGIDFYAARADQLVQGPNGWELEFNEFLSKVKIDFHPHAWEFALAFTAKLGAKMRPGAKFPFLMTPHWVGFGEDENECILCPKKTLGGLIKLCASPVGKVKQHDIFVLGAPKGEARKKQSHPPRNLVFLQNHLLSSAPISI